jgi:amino acid transporter
MYIALGITTVLYVLISIGVFGTLTVEEVIANGGTALAQAAKPALGEAGFVMMAIAAVLATSSSVNANIYAATGSTAKLAESEMFPPGLRPARMRRRNAWLGDLGHRRAAARELRRPDRYRLPR